MSCKKITPSLKVADYPALYFKNLQSLVFDYDIIKKISIIIFLFQFSPFSGFSQIQLTNSSFEGKPGPGNIPKGWHTCQAGSTPDLLPGAWYVNKTAKDGDTYLGLISRKDGTYEAVGQLLPAPIKAKVCYSFSIYLSRSLSYAGYDWPLSLRIWGGNKICSRDVLLAETPAIEHNDWRRYDLEFFSPTNLSYLTIEGYFAPGLYFHYNGNILLDQASPIIPCKRAFHSEKTQNQIIF